MNEINEAVKIFTRFRIRKNRLDVILRLTDYITPSKKNFNKKLKQFYIFP